MGLLPIIHMAHCGVQLKNTPIYLVLLLMYARNYFWCAPCCTPYYVTQANCCSQNSQVKFECFFNALHFYGVHQAALHFIGYLWSANIGTPCTLEYRSQYTKFLVYIPPAHQGFWPTGLPQPKNWYACRKLLECLKDDPKNIWGQKKNETKKQNCLKNCRHLWFSFKTYNWIKSSCDSWDLVMKISHNTTTNQWSLG